MGGPFLTFLCPTLPRMKDRNQMLASSLDQGKVQPREFGLR